MWQYCCHQAWVYHWEFHVGESRSPDLIKSWQFTAMEPALGYWQDIHHLLWGMTVGVILLWWAFGQQLYLTTLMLKFPKQPFPNSPCSDNTTTFLNLETKRLCNGCHKPACMQFHKHAVRRVCIELPYFPCCVDSIMPQCSMNKRLFSDVQYHNKTAI